MTSITINGKIISVLEKSFENKKTIYAQFLMESESKGMEILKVKITNENDISKIEKELKEAWFKILEKVDYHYGQVSAESERVYFISKKS